MTVDHRNHNVNFFNIMYCFYLINPSFVTFRALQFNHCCCSRIPVYDIQEEVSRVIVWLTWIPFQHKPVTCVTFPYDESRLH